jgi:hypothetical protein
MKLLKHILVFKILLVPCSSLAQQPSPQITPSQAVDNLQGKYSDVKIVAQALFNPVFPNITPPSPNPYPTTSINENAVTALFGNAGLNVDADLLRYIKNFYFYLEYVTKLECAALLAAYGHQQNIDVTTLLEKSTWIEFVDALVKKAGSWANLVGIISSGTLTPDWQEVQGSIVVSSWKDVVNTPFWKAISVTPAMIINSSFWQDFCKYTITRSFVQDTSILESIYQTDQSIFRFIPNIEVAYYHPDFSQLRNAAEFHRLHLVLTDEVRNRLLKQTKDWSTIINPTTKQFDLVKINDQATVYQKTGFYQLISIANSSSLGDLTQQGLQKQLPIDLNYAKQPLVQEKLQCLAMLKNIQAQTYYLFDATHLDQTMKLLANQATLPVPSFLLYTTDDYVYLEDLDRLLTNFKDTAAQEAANPSAALQIVMNSHNNLPHDELVTVQDFGSWISGLWNDIKQAGQDVWQGMQDFGKTVVDEAEALGYGIAGAFVGAIDPNKAKDFVQKSKQLQQDVSNDITNTIQDAQNVINDTAKVAKDVTYGAASLVGTVFSKIDDKLGKDIEGALDSVADRVIDFYADMQHVVVAYEGGIVRLTADAVNYATTVVADTVVAVKSGDWQGLGQDALNGLKSIAYDVVSSIISVGTFVVQQIVDQIKALVKFAGYIVSIITDLTIDTFKAVFSGLSSAFSAFGWQGGQQAMQTASDWVQNHRRLIEATVTTGLLVAAVVATDGLALPVLAMTVGPQLFQVAGGYQADERAAEKKAEQKQFVSDYQTYVANNKIISGNAKDAWADELSKKYQAQITNQERELGFYQNFLQSYFTNTENQMSYYLGQSLVPQITPDPTFGIINADVGSLYGFNTGVLNLNPSQGFPLYNNGRKAYSQEIAVSPALAISSDGQSVTSSTPRKFWFNQKETIPLTQDTPMVEVKWRALYTLNNFSIGVYFGGEVVDLDAIKKSGSAPLDVSHLAKMVVYKKDSKDQPITLNLYEHEGKGWFAQPTGPDFAVGQWYHMRLQLANATLSVQIWKEGTTPPAPQTFTISPTKQQTIGVISSGASIEYQIITPQILPQANTKLRPTGALGIPTEKQREVDARKKMQQLTNPPIGSLNLQAINKPSILKGQYIYTTNATGLTDAQKKPIADYVTLGQAAVGTQGATIINQIGISPLLALSPGASAPSVVSLISQRAYDQNAKQIATCPHVLESFVQTHGQLPDDTTKTINDLRSTYASSLIGPFSFGAISLQATSAQDVVDGHSIYKATSPASELRDSQGNPVKDSTGAILYDYFLMKTNDGVLGAPYDTSISTMRSLVTGYEYNKTSNTPLSVRYSAQTTLNVYQKNTGSLPTSLVNAINASTTYYQQTVKQEQSVDQTQPDTTTTQPVGGGNISNPDGGYSGDSGNQQQINPNNPADQSIQDRTEQASSGDISFGG